MTTEADKDFYLKKHLERITPAGITTIISALQGRKNFLVYMTTRANTDSTTPHHIILSDIQRHNELIEILTAYLNEI